MVIIGFLISGCSNILASTVTVDLGRQDVLKGNKEALSTVVGE
jgi:MFS transporter, OPA family, solute carrier family 37 (glycerol-3-phosphate transporter), member 3